MTKTFTCKELGGICDKEFTGDSLEKIMEQAGPHMMGDEAHKANISSQEKAGETKESWKADMQKKFDAKPEDR